MLVTLYKLWAYIRILGVFRYMSPLADKFKNDEAFSKSSKNFRNIYFLIILIFDFNRLTIIEFLQWYECTTSNM